MNPGGQRSALLDRTVCTLAVLVAGAYLLARAVSVPFTYDEAASLVRYVRGDAGALLDFGVATNHLLNSILSRLSHALLGDSPWALRLPNVLAGIVFLVAADRLATRTRHQAIGLAGLVLFAANPYLMDYLSLSRGYGLALAALTASLVCLMRWMACAVSDDTSSRHLRRALVLAVLAVAANFSTLSILLAIAGVVALRLPFLQRGPHAERLAPPGWSRGLVVTWLIATTVFTALVFARERALSQEWFSPITVRAFGLSAEELDTIQVFRTDPRGRLREMSRVDEGMWRTGEVRDSWGLRVELPAAVDESMARLEVQIGRHVFARTHQLPGHWTIADPDASHRVLLATPYLAAPRPGNPALADAVNWSATARQAPVVVRYTLATVAALSALGLVLFLAAHVTVRLNIAPARDTWALTSVLMAAASMVAAPVYLMRRNGQLYFGGSEGVLPDTFGSLVKGTAYGVEYHADQATWALGLIAAVALATVMAFLLRRKTGDAIIRVPLVPLGVVTLVAVQVAVQHSLLDTPYLTGRTAIGLLPFLLALLVTGTDSVASLGRTARVVVTAVMMTLAVGATAHAFNTFNLWRTLDWQADAATPAMLAAIQSDVDSNTPDGSTAPRIVRIGAEWMYLPVAQYYAGRQSNAEVRYDVHVVPGDEPMLDYLYVRQSFAPDAGTPLQRYPESGAVLWRTRP